MIGGTVGAAENRGLLEAQALRNGVAILGAGIAELGERTEPMPAHHPVADPDPGHVWANRDNFAGRLAARHEGRLWPELVFTGQHQDVDILRAARPDADLHFSSAGWRQVGQLAQREHLGATERLADDRLHAARSYSAASARTGTS